MAATPAAATGTVEAGDGRWLFGPVPDLLVGCNLWYVLLFGALVVAGPALRIAQPAYLAPLLILLVSTPHYGATLVRVYERRDERRAYALFTVWATLALLALFVLGAFRGGGRVRSSFRAVSVTGGDAIGTESRILLDSYCRCAGLRPILRT